MFILWKTVGAGKFCFGLLRGFFFVLPYVSVLKILRILGEKREKKHLPPTRPLGQTLAELMGKRFLKRILPQLCMFKMISVS